MQEHMHYELSGDLDDPNDDESIGDETNQNIDTSALAEGSEKGEHTLSNGRSYALPDEPTNYSLFSNPPDLGAMRRRLFEIEDRIEMSSANFETYFPFVDNIWRRSRTEAPGVEWYSCRLRKSANHKAATPKPTPEGKRGRKKRTREDVTCDMSMKVIYNETPTRTCAVVRAVAPNVRHNHDLDYMDNLKRNKGIMDIARKEAVKGFLPASIFNKMWEEENKMLEAGGKHMKVSDVRNVQYQWRQLNPHVILKAHTGYVQTRSGPRQKTVDSPKIFQIPGPPELAASAPPTLPGTLYYPAHEREFLEPYLPDPAKAATRKTPHITLTYASSLDSRIAVIAGVQTTISGPETKAMTHYLRSRHDAILIGVRTAIADDPSLNCRLAGSGGYGGMSWHQQPRPIIIDPHARLQIRPEMKLLKAYTERRGKGPWIIVSRAARLHPMAVTTLKAHGGEYLMIEESKPEGQPQGSSMNWEGMFGILFQEGIKSIMVEGGGVVLSELLKLQYTDVIDSVLITIAPTFLGKAGVAVSPDPTFNEIGKPLPTRLKQVRWHPMGEEDVVLCGKLREDAPILLPQRNGMLQGIEEFSRSADENGDSSTNGHLPMGPPMNIGRS